MGMSCASCSARVEKTLNRQPGVRKATVNYASATATVEYDSQNCSPEALQQAVQNAGYDLLIKQDENTPDKVEQAHDKKYRALKFRTTWAIVLSVPVMVIGMFFMDMPYANLIMWLFSTPVVFWLGRSFFTSAWKQLKHGTANMDTLVANSTGIAYLFSLFNMLFPEFWLERGIHPHVYFEAASVIIAFILLGRLLEEKAKGNTSSAIRKLMGLQPKTVTVITGPSSEKVVPIEQIRPGDIILVKPGERIAVDGIVTEGSSYVDESMLSGEPVAVAKQKNAKVFAGTINQKGSFRFSAEKVGTDTLLAKIIHMVQDAQGSKAPRPAIGRQDCGHLRAGYYRHCRTVLHRMDVAGWAERFYTRIAGAGYGTYHRLPVCPGTCHTHRHHGRHRQRCGTGHSDKRRRKPGNRQKD